MSSPALHSARSGVAFCADDLQGVESHGAGSAGGSEDAGGGGSAGQQLTIQQQKGPARLIGLADAHGGPFQGHFRDDAVADHGRLQGLDITLTCLLNV